MTRSEGDVVKSVSSSLSLARREIRAGPGLTSLITGEVVGPPIFHGEILKTLVQYCLHPNSENSTCRLSDSEKIVCWL